MAVKSFPEFGFIYFAVIIDMQQDAYRVRQTPATRVSANEWYRIKSSTSPYRDFMNRGDDSGWQTAPASGGHRYRDAIADYKTYYRFICSSILPKTAFSLLI